MDVYSGFIYNCQNVAATKMSHSGWMDKYNVLQPDNEILFIMKEKWVTMKKTCIYFTNGSHSEKATFWKTKNWRDNEDQWLPGVGVEEGMNNQSTEDF